VIASISKGAGFAGAYDYVTEKDGSRVLGGTFFGVLGGGEPDRRAVMAEAARVREMRPNLNRAVFHVSLSLPPDEHLSDADWLEASQRYMDKMGMQNTPYVVVRHTDTPHEHVHLVAIRIDRTTGKTISDSQDYERTALAVRDLEEGYGLRLAATTPSEARGRAVRPRGSRETHQHQRLTGEHPSDTWRRIEERFRKTGDLAVAELTPRDRVLQFSQVAAQRSETLPEYIHSLRGVGVSVLPNVARTGRVTGLTYLDERSGKRWKASSLGARFGMRGLKASGVTYDVARDYGYVSGRESEPPTTPESPREVSPPPPPLPQPSPPPSEARARTVRQVDRAKPQPSSFEARTSPPGSPSSSPQFPMESGKPTGEKRGSGKLNLRATRRVRKKGPGPEIDR